MNYPKAFDKYFSMAYKPIYWQSDPQYKKHVYNAWKAGRKHQTQLPRTHPF